jgi:hypothetical protein
VKKVFSVIFSLLLLSVSTSNILATPGRLRGASIISCNGVNYGQHGDGHWHITVEHPSGWYPSGGSLGHENPCETSHVENPNVSNTESPNTSNVETHTVAEVTKSNDTSLREIVMGSESFTEFESIITLSTTDEVLSIIVNARDSKATVELESSNTPLEIGLNTRTITVTAEDGTVAEYTLEITRERVESSNANLSSLLVDSEEIPASDEMEYITGSDRISISATAEDENAVVSIDNYELKIGMNEIGILVTAEDSTRKEYILIVRRLSNKTGILVTINGAEIHFDSFQAELEVDHSIEELEIDYILEIIVQQQKSITVRNFVKGKMRLL